MADIELVIKISEEEYAFCKEQWDTECSDILMIAVKYGIPLPKGHGRLIDADAFKDNLALLDKNDIDLTPTIIEANKEEDQ